MSSDNNTAINFSALADAPAASAATTPKTKTPCSTTGCKKSANLTFTKAGRPLCVDCIGEWGWGLERFEIVSRICENKDCDNRCSGRYYYCKECTSAHKKSKRETTSTPAGNVESGVRSLRNPQLKDCIAALSEELAALEEELAALKAERQRRIDELNG
jgi:hypothetical protein